VAGIGKALSLRIALREVADIGLDLKRAPGRADQDLVPREAAAVLPHVLLQPSVQGGVVAAAEGVREGVLRIAASRSGRS